MIRLIKILVVLAVIWSGWWFASAYGLRQSIAGWFAAQQTRGWQAEFAQIATSGYPLRHITRLDAPTLADPANGTAWRADWISFDSPAAWPGRQTLRFARTAQRLSYFYQTVTLTAQDMAADLRLKPGVALELTNMSLTAGPWAVAAPDGAVMQAQSLTLAMDQREDPRDYAITIDAQNFAPGDGLRRLVRTGQTLPPAFETLTLQMQVRFSRPWDRSALEDNRSQPTEIALRLADVQWGPLRIQAAGKVTVDTDGVPTGAITLKADNWREMLAMARASGSLPSGLEEPAERALTFLSGLGGNPNALDLKLNFRDGFVALGPLPLGPAPRLVIR